MAVRTSTKAKRATSGARSPMKAAKKPAAKASAARASAAKKPGKAAKPSAAKPARPASEPSAAAPASTPAATPPAPPPVWVWHECVTSDVVGAKSFYTGLLGWESHDVQMPTGPYTLFRKDGKDIAGCMSVPMQDGKACCPPNWCAYVAVADVDATAKRAAELGGKVAAGPMEVPGIGRFAVLVDPQGASFAIFRPAL